MPLAVVSFQRIAGSRMILRRVHWNYYELRGVAVAFAACFSVFCSLALRGWKTENDPSLRTTDTVFFFANPSGFSTCNCESQKAVELSRNSVRKQFIRHLIPGCCSKTIMYINDLNLCQRVGQTHRSTVYD
jgi:hypothetical protein